MKVINYDQEYIRLKDKTLEEVLNDPLFADVRKETEEIEKTITHEE